MSKKINKAVGKEKRNEEKINAREYIHMDSIL